MYSLKVMTVTKKRYSKCSVFAFGFETCIKTIFYWSIAWSMKLLTTYQSHAASAHWRPSLVSDKHVPACRFQALAHWCGFHAARGDSEWCILLWCLAAQTVAVRHLSSCWRLLLSSASRVRKSTELLWHKTPDFTPDQTWPPDRPNLSSVDYRLLSVIQECVCQKQQVMSNIVDELWLLTEWYFY